MTQTLPGKDGVATCSKKDDDNANIFEAASSLCNAKETTHSRKDTSCNIEVTSSVYNSISPDPQIGGGNSSQGRGNIKKFKVNKMSNNKNVAKDQKGKIMKSKLNSLMSQNEYETVLNEEKTDNNFQQPKILKAKQSPLKNNFTSQSNPQASMPPENAYGGSRADELSTIKTNQQSSNTNFITRDAQNVFDKKKMRFEKIRKMRGLSEQNNNTSMPSIDQSMGQHQQSKGALSLN